MTISISQQAYEELLHQQTISNSQDIDPDDGLDMIYKYPQALGKGYLREIELQQGLELIAILIAHETEIRNGSSNPQPLKPDVVDRIYHAREILLQRLDNPPSLNQLARQVGLNECTLKRGFRSCFGTTVFGYLRNYKLEQARQLLEAGDMKVTEIARAVGYTSRSPFAAAFRKQFGMNPKEYQKHQKNSV
jgi:AraC-like DNA-binding protein